MAGDDWWMLELALLVLSVTRRAGPCVLNIYIYISRTPAQPSQPASASLASDCCFSRVNIPEFICRLRFPLSLSLFLFFSIYLSSTSSPTIRKLFNQCRPGSYSLLLLVHRVSCFFHTSIRRECSNDGPSCLHRQRIFWNFSFLLFFYLPKFSTEWLSRSWPMLITFPPSLLYTSRTGSGPIKG